MSSPDLRLDGGHRYARGWHCLGLEADFPVDAPKGVDAFGTRLVVYRTSAGWKARGAWCPHMGADLALGAVEGDELVCKFHGWRWADSGRCSGVPYARRVPPKARLQTYPVASGSGFLYVWHDPEGADPDYEIPAVAVYGKDDWSGWTMFEWEVRGKLCDVIDNVADVAHFSPVHSASSVAYFGNLHEGVMASQVMVGDYDGMGATARFTTYSTYYGPAVQFTTMSGGVNGVPMEAVLLNSHVPLSPDRFLLRFGMMMQKFTHVPPAQDEMMRKAITQMNSQSFAQDVEIWKNKVWIDTPMLADGDGPILLNRRWYEQFYTDAPAAGLVGPAAIETVSRSSIESPPQLRHVF